MSVTQFKIIDLIYFLLLQETAINLNIYIVYDVILNWPIHFISAESFGDIIIVAFKRNFQFKKTDLAVLSSRVNGPNEVADFKSEVIKFYLFTFSSTP